MATKSESGAKSKKIKCEYDEDEMYGYTCSVEMDQEIPPDTNLEFIGAHETGKTNDDVKCVDFNNIKASKLPSGLTIKFPNMDRLHFCESEMKDISRKDLYEYRNLKQFLFLSNEIDYLPGDLFADCKNLEEIGFFSNPLTIIEPNILDGLEHLKYVDFLGSNCSYGEIRSEAAFKSTDPQLLKMKAKLYTEYAKKLPKDQKEMVKFQSFIKSEETMKDLRIDIDDKQFPVHKIFIAFKSPFFAEIIRNNPDAEYFKLEGISAKIFKKILKYIYTNQFPHDVDFMKLFAASEYLKIEDLKQYAFDKILEQLNHENALDILRLGNKYGHEEMKHKAFEEIKQEYQKMELKDEWLNEDEKLEQIIEHLQIIRDTEKKLADLLGEN